MPVLSAETNREKIQFSIPAQRADLSLTEYARVTGRKLLFPYDIVSQYRTNEVVGEYDADLALTLLLSNTGLVMSTSDQGNMIIQLDKTRGEKPIMKKLYGFLATLATALVATNSPAQSDSSGGGFVLEEVVVTARKIEEDLQSTPVSVTALSGDALEDRDALNIMDAGNIAPNVALGDSASFSGSSSAPTVFIRGIGQADFLIVNDPAVGIYLDGVYVARSIGGLVDLVDLERAEVLRGPQGTLFGRNTIGGAINLISKKPDETFNARLSGTVGEDDHYEDQLSVNAPLSDTLFTRFSALYRKRDGYVDAAQYNNLKLGEDDSLTLRGQLRFLPAENVTIDLSVDYTREREAPSPVIARNIT